MNIRYIILLSIILSLTSLEVYTQSGQGWQSSLKEEKSFIEEKGQFKEFLENINISIEEPIICGVENEEFNAYLTKKGIYFVFPEQKKLTHEDRERMEEEGEGESENQVYKSIWHKIAFKWKSKQGDKITPLFRGEHPFYYSYSALKKENVNKFNFIKGYKGIELKNIFEGCDIIFELPNEGGIKYQLVVQDSEKKSFDFYWENISNIADTKGPESMVIQTKFLKSEENQNDYFNLTDKKPFAYLEANKEDVELKYGIEDSVITFTIPSGIHETIIIDPWLQNPNFINLNKAYDIQTDGLGNVIVLGNYSQAANGYKFHIKKYDPTGTFLWDYTYYAKFLGDIAVDNVGNIYHIGNYPTGGRVKLDPSATQLWNLSGFAEEWRLAFNYDKTLLSIGGNFVTPAANLGSIDMATGNLTSQMSYSEETRAITTDCSGDIYALTIPSGSTCNLRKISNFTLVNTVPAGFPVNYNGVGYVLNPDYSPSIYQGFNGMVIDGDFLYIYNGAEVRKFNKLTLAFITAFTPVNSSYMRCSGVVTDYCGNLYVGTMNGINVYDPSLNYVSTISTPGAVYDIILANDGTILASGESFLGSFVTNCSLPSPLVGATSSVNCEQGAITANLAGGTLPYSYEWGPNGETTSNISNLSAGDYTLEAIDKFCNSYFDTVTIHPLPHVEFSLQDSCEYDAVNFYDASSIAPSEVIAGYSWDIDNDGVEDYNTQNPTHLYAAGNYTVKLKVTSGNGCVKDTTMTALVYPKPQANFTFLEECLYDSLSFIDASLVSGGDVIISHGWNFGESVSPPIQSTLTNPYHTYGSEGSYSVSEIVVTANGCIDTVSQQVEVFEIPVAAFSIADVCLDTAAVYIDQSTLTNGTIINWNWDFGDLSYGTSQNENHNYAANGTYQVKLIVETSENCKDTIEQNVVVYPMPQVAFSMQDDCLEESIQFTDNSIINIPGALSLFTWNFGDQSSPSNLQSPLHLYNSPGSYDVSLSVVSADNCISTLQQSVIVHPLPQVSFTASEICVNEPPTTFTNTSVIASGVNVSYSWNFGDANNTISTTESPTFNYGVHGEYEVMLAVVSDMGCMDTIIDTINVKHKPIALFTQDTTGGCAPICVNFVSQSLDSISISNWNWKFENNLGEGSNKYEGYCYNEAGTYDVKLIVENVVGCFDTIESLSLISTFGYPFADFELTPANALVTDAEITFTNLSTDAIIWRWDFDDTELDSINFNPVHTYQDTGVYLVELIVYNANGCSSTAYHQVIISPIENVFVPTAFSPNGDGENDILFVRGYLNDIYFSVYDRWGKKVFESNSPTVGWDGMINGKKANEGVYMWYLQTSINGEGQKFKGDVSLMR